MAPVTRIWNAKPNRIFRHWRQDAMVVYPNALHLFYRRQMAIYAPHRLVIAMPFNRLSHIHPVTIQAHPVISRGAGLAFRSHSTQMVRIVTPRTRQMPHRITRTHQKSQRVVVQFAVASICPELFAVQHFQFVKVVKRIARLISLLDDPLVRVALRADLHGLLRTQKSQIYQRRIPRWHLIRQRFPECHMLASISVACFAIDAQVCPARRVSTRL